MAIWNQMAREVPDDWSDYSEVDEKKGDWGYDAENVAKRRPSSTSRLHALLFTFVLISVCLVSLVAKIGQLDVFHPCGEQEYSESIVEKSFEITIEELPVLDPVHSERLLNYSFGDSWGRPAHVSFVPYSGSSYNKIILELSTNVTGTQYDRLAHVFLDNVTVWRTSTVEAYSADTIVSQSSKDITPFISLFEENRALDLTFQLDNIVTSKQTGVFNVELKIHYYNEPDPEQDVDRTATDFFYHYATTPPSRVLPLVNDHKKRTPLLYYPSASSSNPRWRRPLTDFHVDDATVEHAILEVFASGNAAEEFWYGNVLDKYVSKFRNSLHEVMGHGPFRILQVYLYDGEEEYLVSSVVPTPVIFTGGFSPALWKPCVGIDAFDLESFLVDLTPFLPLLRDQNKPWELQLEIVSSLDDAYKTTIGENWIISGNLRQWLNSDSKLVHNHLETNNFTSTFNVDVYDRNPSHLHQAVNATTKNMVLSEVLHDDVPYVFAHTFENEFVSNLTFFDDGNIENFMVSLNKYSIISLYEKDKYGSSDPVISLVDKSSWDFVANIHILDVDVSKSEVTYKATVGRTIDRYKYIKDYTAKKETDITDSDGLFDYMKKHDSTPHTIINAIQGSQTGTSEFTLSPSGNHGTADSVHSVKVTKEFPLKEHYKRDVIVSDNVVVFDVIKRDG